MPRQGPPDQCPSGLAMRQGQHQILSAHQLANCFEVSLPPPHVLALAWPPLCCRQEAARGHAPPAKLSTLPGRFQAGAALCLSLCFRR